MAVSPQSIDRFIAPGSPLARAGGAQTLLRATGGNLPGAALLAAIARKESSFGAQAFAPNNFWGYGVHDGPSVNTAPTVEAMAHRVWQGLNGSLYRGAGLTTPETIFPRYAPPGENNTKLYIQQVQDWLRQEGVDPNTNVFSGARVPVSADASGATPRPGAMRGGAAAASPLALLAALQSFNAPGATGPMQLSALQTLAALRGGAGAQMGAGAAGGGSAPAPSGVGYVNPFPDQGRMTRERVDMGFDLGGAGRVLALGPGVVTTVKRGNSGWPGSGPGGGSFVEYRLTSGPQKGRYVYVAEDFAPAVAPGQRINAGTLLGRATGGHTGIETGWGAGDGGHAYASQMGGGYSEGQRTAAGQAFSDFIRSLGGPAGTTGGRPVTGRFR